ncbi:hypothetical protein [Paenibacillus protaetiae]|uniref:Isochorismatase family protein n=1 Tax=Paenibacillus protaetiae TaxID=2509456 RepID=A0A4P6EXQ6_9BACL|nr:hypothetical protein [Paenibacillus protaetiae]QAY66529.1 hypothetical protein ET464_08990 [Paenibacillus protaetiae]
MAHKGQCLVPFESLFNRNEIGGKSTTDLNSILALASKEQLPAAGTDQDRTLLLLVDQQNSFMEGGELGVPGSLEDTARLGGFLYRNLHRITQIAMTQDVHTPLQIFHPCWWRSPEGQHPAPVETVITLEAVERGEWIAQFHPEESLAYVRQLRLGGKRELRIWPYHCLEGTFGAQFESQLMNLVYYHSAARQIKPVILGKGDDPLSEMYGAFLREDGLTSEANRAFLDSLTSYSRIYVAGQALSHCVLDTLTQLLEYHAGNKAFTGSVHLLTDCSSPIPGTEDVTKAAIEQLVQRYGIQVVQGEQLTI